MENKKVMMFATICKYGLDGDEFVNLYDSKSKALEAAKDDWRYFTTREKQKNTIYVGLIPATVDFESQTIEPYFDFENERGIMECDCDMIITYMEYNWEYEQEKRKKEYEELE